MFSQFLSVATLGKSALALSLVASAYGAASFDKPEYRTLHLPAHETTRPQTTPMPTPGVEHPTTTLSFDALLSECVSRYKRGATNTKEACDLAIAASGLSTDAFIAKYRSLLVPPTKTATAKPTATPKTTTAPKLNTTDPKVKACLAKYETLRTLKSTGSETFDAALKYFTETCKSVLEARG